MSVVAVGQRDPPAVSRDLLDERGVRIRKLPADAAGVALRLKVKVVDYVASPPLHSRQMRGRYHFEWSQRWYETRNGRKNVRSHRPPPARDAADATGFGRDV